MAVERQQISLDTHNPRARTNLPPLLLTRDIQIQTLGGTVVPLRTVEDKASLRGVIDMKALSSMLLDSMLGKGRKAKLEEKNKEQFDF